MNILIIRSFVQTKQVCQRNGRFICIFLKQGAMLDAILDLALINIFYITYLYLIQLQRSRKRSCVHEKMYIMHYSIANSTSYNIGRHFGRHLGFCETLKGAKVAPGIFEMSRLSFIIINQEKNYITQSKVPLVGGRTKSQDWLRCVCNLVKVLIY